ncbi:hypothetical protein ACIBG7_14905 [Nonomuraea sp. NPDC050328]|uniref:hypothetical protein n=1 Tax=Nonomuraea sp. NPDC050328 TaxID=3364361 RepID=UPI0037907616
MLIKSVAAVLLATLALGPAGDPYESAGADFTAAAERSTGQGVRVALVSSGIAEIPALAGSVKARENLTGRSGTANIGGTAVATLIKRLAPGVSFLSAQVDLEPEDFPTTAAYDDWWKNKRPHQADSTAIRWAAEQSADVIVVETYWERPGSDMMAAVAEATKRGAVVVAPAPVCPAGWKCPGETYPAGLPGVIGVTPLTDKGEPTAPEYAAGAGGVLLAAPGRRTTLPGPGERLWELTGAPVSNAYVAAAAALVRSHAPELRPGRVVESLLASARLPGADGGWLDQDGYEHDDALGFGLVNPAGALEAADRLTAAPPAAGLSPGSRFVAGPAGRIEAVRPDPLLTAGYGGLLAAGVGLLIVAGTLALATRRRRTSAPPPGPDAPSTTT